MQNSLFQLHLWSTVYSKTSHNKYDIVIKCKQLFAVTAS